MFVIQLLHISTQPPTTSPAQFGVFSISPRPPKSAEFACNHIAKRFSFRIFAEADIHRFHSPCWPCLFGVFSQRHHMHLDPKSIKHHQNQLSAMLLDGIAPSPSRDNGSTNRASIVVGWDAEPQLRSVLMLHSRGTSRYPAIWTPAELRS